jgi:hypothetical protein
MIILALDALDLSMVKRYNCKNLMQLECGQTDISEFQLARTVVLWASFLTGKNMEARIPVKTVGVQTIDRSAYFDEESTVEDYDVVVWGHHDENKKDFFDSLDGFDIVMGYFDLADAIGHLSYGIPDKMEEAYQELESMAREVESSSDEVILVISDHGMKAVGRFGDHTKNGFYSVNRRLRLSVPRITDFHSMLEGVA